MVFVRASERRMGAAAGGREPLFPQSHILWLANREAHSVERGMALGEGAELDPEIGQTINLKSTRIGESIVLLLREWWYQS